MLEDWYLVTNAATEAIHIAKKNHDRKWCSLLEKLKALEICDSAEIQEAIEVCKTVHL